MNWLLTPSLQNSRWLTDGVKNKFAKLHVQGNGEPPPEEINKLLLESAELLQGKQAVQDSSLLERLETAYQKIWSDRYEEMLKPLLVDHLAQDIPPAAIAAHNGDVIPYIAFLPDGGRLILIDPLNYKFVLATCSILLQWVYNPLDQKESAELFRFLISTVGGYSLHRNFARERLNSPAWNSSCWRIIHRDTQLLPIAEGVAVNILAYAFYHEVSHSFLGHEGTPKESIYRNGGRIGDVPILHWGHIEEYQADELAGKYFKRLISMRPSLKSLPTGEQVDHSPLMLFLLMELIWLFKEKVEGRRIFSKSHPRPRARAEMLKAKLKPFSHEGATLYEAFEFAIQHVQRMLETDDEIIVKGLFAESEVLLP